MYILHIKYTVEQPPAQDEVSGTRLILLPETTKECTKYVKKCFQNTRQWTTLDSDPGVTSGKSSRT